MLRDSWTFTYATERVALAAEEKAKPLRRNVAENRAKLNEHQRIIGIRKVDEYNLGAHPEEIQAIYRESRNLPPIIQDEGNALSKLEFFIRILRQHQGEVVALSLDDIRYFGLDQDDAPAHALPKPKPAYDAALLTPTLRDEDRRSPVRDVPIDLDEVNREAPPKTTRRPVAVG